MCHSILGIDIQVVKKREKKDYRIGHITKLVYRPLLYCGDASLICHVCLCEKPIQQETFRSSRTDITINILQALGYMCVCRQNAMQLPHKYSEFAFIDRVYILMSSKWNVPSDYYQLCLWEQYGPYKTGKKRFIPYRHRQRFIGKRHYSLSAIRKMNYIRLNSSFRK